MNSDDTLFSYASRLQSKAVARVEAHAGETAISLAVAATLKTALLMGQFTAEDVRALHGDFGMPDPRAWGAVMKRAAGTGKIRATDRYAKTGRASSHDRPMRVWRYLG